MGLRFQPEIDFTASAAVPLAETEMTSLAADPLQKCGKGNSLNDRRSSV
ncbi:hypothetical protein H6F67_03845 [Microcoleus sp. FACHB-1515]|nr:hypothetical protein [Microcoleus sp. FACHB-1515]MBD2088985.1 hypothetical protein [Microcoleus sp. FACHB-1515]